MSAEPSRTWREQVVIDFLHLLADRSVAMLAASAAGVVLANPRGEPRLAAASSEKAGLLGLFRLQNDQGPCLECFRTGQAVTATDLAGPAPQWPRFAQAAAPAGFRSVEALPLRLRDQVIGALDLFSAGGGPLGADLRIGQALADVATIRLLHERDVHRREQLQGALNSRVMIEQAKGKLAERPSRNAIQHSGLPAVRDALTRAFAGSRTPDATYRQENIFGYLVARV